MARNSSRHVTCSTRTNDWIFTKDELLHSPSRPDGITWEDELRRRRDGCRFIDQLCKALDLVKLVQIAADYYFHRFFMRQSLHQHELELVATACVLVASKMEDNFRKIGDFARAIVRWRRDNARQQWGADDDDHLPHQQQQQQLYQHRKQEQEDRERKRAELEAAAAQIMAMESLLLHVLAYDLVLKRPHEFVNDHVIRIEAVLKRQLSEEQVKALNTRIKHAAWSLLNDSAYTCAYLCGDANDLAAGAVYLAGLHRNNVPSHWVTQDGQPWWTLLQTPLPVLQEAAKLLLLAYVEPYVEKTPSSLEALVYQFQPGIMLHDYGSPPPMHLDGGTSPECASLCPNDSETESTVSMRNARDPESSASTNTCAVAATAMNTSGSSSSLTTVWKLSALCGPSGPRKSSSHSSSPYLSSKHHRL